MTSERPNKGRSPRVGKGQKAEKVRKLPFLPFRGPNTSPTALWEKTRRIFIIFCAPNTIDFILFSRCAGRDCTSCRTSLFVHQTWLNLFGALNAISLVWRLCKHQRKYCLYTPILCVFYVSYRKAQIAVDTLDRPRLPTHHFLSVERGDRIEARAMQS